MILTICKICILMYFNFLCIIHVRRMNNHIDEVDINNLSNYSATLPLIGRPIIVFTDPQNNDSSFD